MEKQQQNTQGNAQKPEIEKVHHAKGVAVQVPQKQPARGKRKPLL